MWNYVGCSSSLGRNGDGPLMDGSLNELIVMMERNDV